MLPGSPIKSLSPLPSGVGSKNGTAFEFIVDIAGIVTEADTELSAVVRLPLLLLAASPAPLLPLSCQEGIPGARNPKELARLLDAVVTADGPSTPDMAARAGVDIDVDRMVAGGEEVEFKVEVSAGEDGEEESVE